MLILLVVIVVAGVLFAVGAFIAGRLDGAVPWPPDARPFPLPEGRLDAGDVARARFGIAFRGYRMADVDAALWRIAGELAARDAELGLLREERASPPRVGAGPAERVSPVRLSKEEPAGPPSPPVSAGPPSPPATGPCADRVSTGALPDRVRGEPGNDA
ncbi:MAG: DivIVA domain-containing protein [Frankiaceae bacterium]